MSEEAARCNVTASNAEGIHHMCGRPAFALVPARDHEGRSVGGLQVCWEHLLPTLARAQESRSR